MHREGIRRRVVAIFTGNRSEYGLQFPILRAIAADPRLDYRLLAGGSHLNQDFGRTVSEIEADGFQVWREVTIPCRPASAAYTALSIAAGIESVSRILTELAPDFILLYGDRSESFAAMIASTQMNIPTVHVEGGDYTEGGALDDSVRHAMTKLAHLHLTTNREAAERLLKLGEEPWRVFTVGLPTLDLARQKVFAQPAELVAQFNFDLARPVILFCQHPIATEPGKTLEQIQPSLEALVEFAGEGGQVLVTYPNNDAGCEIIIGEIKRFAGLGLRDVHVMPSLGRRRFHGMLHLMGAVGCGVLVGNSSAGVKETRAFGCPCVNIGSRQRGRLRSANVIDVEYEKTPIIAAIRRCVRDQSFRELCRTCASVYGEGDSGARIAEILATVPINLRLLQKRLTY
jgi:UDP-hydrolysing UDP-N-acetyl-D-glucosamine 2-epimerase